MIRDSQPQSHRRLLITFFLLATIAPPLRADVHFAAPFLSFKSGGFARGVAVGDLDGDGHPDLIVCNEQNQLAVMRGIGDGTFHPPQIGASASGPAALAAGDFDGDNKRDVAVVNNSNSITIHHGNGDGSLGSYTTFAMPSGSSFSTRRGIAIADINADGKLDVVGWTQSPGTISIFLGNGDGTLGARSDITGPIFNLVIGNINGDTRPDLVYVSGTEVTVRLGNGDGTFAAPLAVSVGGSSTFPLNAVAIGDFNGDTRPDLAVSRGPLSPSTRNQVGIVLGNGDGTFGAVSDNVVGTSAFRIASADFDGDGKLDVVTVNTLSNLGGSASLLRGRGDGTFDPSREFASPINPTGTAIGDFDADGRADLAVSSRISGSVGVLAGRAGGSLGDGRSFATGLPPYIGPGAYFVEVADVDGDTFEDMVTVSGYPDTASVFLGELHGAFAAPIRFPVERQPQYLALGDLNGDDRIDLVFANGYVPVTFETDSTVSVMLGNGDGTFGTPVLYEVGRGPGDIEIVDLNGDDKLDLVVAINNQLQAPIGQTVSVLLGHGDGTFEPRASYPTGPRPYALEVGDLNGDQVPDLVVNTYDGNELDVLLGDGDGTLTPGATYAALNLGGFAIGDVDGDAILDLVYNHGPSADSVAIKRGAGDGTFVPFSEMPIPAFSYVAGLVDFDLDGDLDLATVDYTASIAVLEGDGDGAFSPSTIAFGLGASPGEPEFEDMNGDLFPDVLSGNQYLNDVSVLYNVPRGPTGVPDAPRPRGTSIALAAPQPNPSRGDFTVLLTLATKAPAKLELFDLAGRRMLSRELGALGAGSHRVRLASPVSLAPGVYVIRLSQAGSAASRRAVVTR